MFNGETVSVPSESTGNMVACYVGMSSDNVLVRKRELEQLR